MPNRNITIIIPAKGSSSRLEKKNIRLLNGIPLLLYTIETAKEWGQCSSIYVNSEDDDILKIASINGVKPYKRPTELSEDDVIAVEVIKEQIETQEIDSNEIIVLLQVTCPLRNRLDLDNAFRIFEENDMEAAVVSVTEYEKAPEQSFYIDKRNRLQHKYPREYHLLTQKHKKAHRYNTCIVINTAKGFLEQDDTVGKNPIPYVMPPERSIDIDYEHQLYIAELIIKDRERSGYET